jgi:rubredoxin
MLIVPELQLETGIAATDSVETEETMKSYMCVVCGFVYDEEKGLPDEGIPAGTKWEDVPETWKCPECGASKEEFEMIEV